MTPSRSAPASLLALLYLENVTSSPSVRLRVSVMLIGLLRYAQVIEKHRNCILNTAGLSTTWICAAGLILLGNFQVFSLTFMNSQQICIF